MLEVNITKKLRAFTLDVNFKADNNALALLGQSGSGKSMTLKCIAGVEKPDSGKIVLDGEILYDSTQGICLPPQKRRIGLLFQNYALFPMMTLLQNVMSGCKQIPRKARKAHALELIKRFGLEGFENTYPNKLSGGEQQRAALARMLAANPRLLLFDEPFSALDTHLRRQLSQMTADVLRNYDGSAIVVSHDCAEAFRLCPQIAVMEKGKITAHKDRVSLFKAPETVAAAKLIGCENILPVRTGEKNVIVSNLGIIVDKIKPDEITAIGLPANAIHIDNNGEYKFNATVIQIINSPYEVTLVLNMDYSKYDIFCSLPNSVEIPKLYSNITFSFDKKDIFFLKGGN
ncbi:MAG TPA: ATP-binding cassette domain-containing protein [Candidatus Butyricicoccus avistercoris]|uniref:ATP-binding cassette domain-containing protein n=1 Tax=Candidatus Butyricicoccus avistercoris TaxID=2838518 RepID=A0A9D1PIM1_9FIRM|nr:ATP-binding cassette domain-containing protein [Candidatus Butyricicoccus avistercoris]